MKKNGDVMKFDFQDIELAEIPKLIPTKYRSKYGELAAHIVERVNAMASDKSFIFKPRGIEKLPDDLVARICSGVNVYFAKGQMNWKIRYSESAKVFVVVPYPRKNGIPRAPKIVKASAENSQAGFKEDAKSREVKLLNLMHKVFGVTLRQLQEKKNQEMTDYKRAMLYVGRNGLGLKLSDMSHLLGISSGSSTPFCQEAVTIPSAKEKVELLAAELNRG